MVGRGGGFEGEGRGAGRGEGRGGIGTHDAAGVRGLRPAGKGTGGTGDRGGTPERGAGGVAGIGSGGDESVAIEGSEGGGVARERLYSRQHVGHRHSMTSVPSASL